MKIIQPKTGIELYEKTSHEFKNVGTYGGLSFSVDEHGEPISLCGKENFNAPVGMEHYIRAILGPEWAPTGYEDEVPSEFKVVNLGIVTTTYQRRIYREGLCGCGRKVFLERFTNACSCGLDYDTSGNVLAPREFWGEETGEHWSECF